MLGVYVTAKSAKKAATVDIARRLAAPILEELGLQLWDVRFEKEGSGWYLRYFIDKEGGININDCEAVSRRVDALLDEEDPIQQSYVLEVSSPGIERQLVKDWHFERYIGQKVAVRLIRPVEGVRDFIGTLVGKVGDNITILLEDDVQMTYETGEAAYTRLYIDFMTGGQD
jgi:ribosome maturation factor RimP